MVVTITSTGFVGLSSDDKPTAFPSNGSALPLGFAFFETDTTELYYWGGSSWTLPVLPIAQIPTGTSSSTVTVGNDARLSDARTPLQHSINGALHSFPGGTTTYLRADGTFAAVTVAAPSFARTFMLMGG